MWEVKFAQWSAIFGMHPAESAVLKWWEVAKTWLKIPRKTPENWKESHNNDNSNNNNNNNNNNHQYLPNQWIAIFPHFDWLP